MEIRKATVHDVPRMMEIYALARQFMVENGNPHQWAERNWPPEELIRRDIERDKSHVCVHEGKIVGVRIRLGDFDGAPTADLYPYEVKVCEYHHAYQGKPERQTHALYHAE